MLDQVDEESLDLVDEVIFDGGACKRVRQEALAFMMDHTEGFEVRSIDNCREIIVTAFLTPFQPYTFDFYSFSVTFYHTHSLTHMSFCGCVSLQFTFHPIPTNI